MRVARRAYFWLPFVAFAALSMLWSLASPIFSPPDENAHAVKAIAEVRGQVTGHKEAGIRQPVFELPPEFRYDPNLLCFAQQPTRPADCNAAVGGNQGTEWAASWVSGYNPVYYYLVGLPSLVVSGTAGIYAMRIASSLLGSLFVAWAFQLALISATRRWMPAGMAFLGLPMVLYLNGAVNPNGVEIVSAASLCVGLLRLLDGDSEAPFAPQLPRWYLWTVVTVSAAALANARALGPLWLIVVVLLCFFAVGWHTTRALFAGRRNYIWMGMTALTGAFSLGWTLWSGSLSGQALPGDAPLVGASFLAGLKYMLRAMPGYFIEALGVFGWLDTSLPPAVYWMPVVAIAVLVALALFAVGRRAVLTVVVTLLCAVFLPAVVQARSVAQTGIIWQGRYGLFLYIALMLIAAWALSARSSSRADFLAPRITWMVVALLWAFNVAAFVLVLRRYVVGQAQPITQMLSAPQWQPPLSWPALVVAYLLVSAFSFAWIGWLARRDRPQWTGDDAVPTPVGN
jgi:hypothetical protein